MATAKKSYSDKLKDPRWQKKRLEILDRDNFTCRICKDSSETLHVHHLEYVKGKEPFDYDNDWLVTLCKFCHVIEEEYAKKYPNNDDYYTDIIKSIKISENTQVYLLSVFKDHDKFIRIIKVDSENKSIIEVISFPQEDLDKLNLSIKRTSDFWANL